MKTRIFCCLFFISLPAELTGEEKKPTVLTGTLGKSVTFHLTMSEPFTHISWLRLRGGSRFNHIATVEAGQPCAISVILSKLKGRLNVSGGDCRSLQITKLQQNDSGLYRAQIEEQGENFRLKIYKTLSASDLKVHCENHTLGDGNSTLQLNCSAGEWENGVNYTWISTRKSEKISSNVVQSHFQNDDTNYTCTAENPVSKASKTVSIKKACEGNQYNPPAALIPVCIVLAIVVIVAAGIACFVMKKRKRAAQSMPPERPGCPVPDEPSKTIYAKIDYRPSETQQTGMKKPRPQKRPKAQEGLHTVYASVVQPKPTDDPSIKTVYDTINAPRRPEGSEFHKLL